METSDKSNLQKEADAFDRQIIERVTNGHIPDLRRAEPCDYFYNNPWRRPEYVKLDFGEKFEIILSSLKKLISREPDSINILEVGCGPGYLSLELARNGYNVTGLDISPQCIEVARKFSSEDPWINKRGPLQYVVGDLHSSQELQEGKFDAILFLGALHHFPEQALTLQKVKKLLVSNGLIIVNEPVRDRVTKGNAAFVHLLSTMLSLNNNFFKKQGVSTERSQLLKEVENKYNELRYENESGEKIQSVNDNEAGYSEMYPQLCAFFKEEIFKWRYAFFHEFIGGLRYDENTNVQVAKFLREMDRILVETGALSATEFFFVGRNIN